MRKVKQEDESKNRAGFCLRERVIGDECGLVPKSVRQGKEFINGKVRRVVRGEENVGDIVKGHEFRNITLRVRLIRQIRKCHRPK